MTTGMEGYEPAMVGHMAWGRHMHVRMHKEVYPRPIKT